MIDRQFKVAWPSGNLRTLLIIYGLLEGMLILGVLYTAHPLPHAGGAVCLFVLFLFPFISTCLFRVEVDVSTMRVRTQFGRKYELNCSDINKVVCTKKDSIKFGPQFYITVASKNDEFTIEGTMDNFDTMAGYILAQLEKENIKQTAVSKSCAEQLKKYRDGSFKRKKKTVGKPR